MTHKTHPLVDAEQAKLAAHAVKQRFDSLNTPIKLNHAYEAVAIAHKYPNWATMKASLTPRTQAAKSAYMFELGEYEEHGRLRIPAADTLAHIHAFSMSQAVRRDLLLNLSNNAIENDAAALFIESIDQDDVKSRTVETLMEAARRNGRAKHFRVVDVSDPASRLGDRFNIIASSTDAKTVAEFIFEAAELNYPYSYSMELLSVAVQLAITGGQRDDLTLAAIRKAINTISRHEGDPSIFGLSIEGRPKLETSLSWVLEMLDAAETNFPRLFDTKTSWGGPAKAISNKDILLVFTSREGSVVGTLIRKLVLESIRTAVMTAGESQNRYPDMVVYDDVDGVDEDDILIKEASLRCVCLAIGNQCPSLPRTFDDSAIRFKSEEGLGTARHTLLTEGGNSSSMVRGWWFRRQHS